MSKQESHLLDALKAELKKFDGVLYSASQTIVNEGVSNFPIFVVHRPALSMGIALIDRAEVNCEWSFSASTLEEFVTKNLIGADKVDDFKKIYKPSDKFLCLFVVENQDANFIFTPFQKERKK